MKKEFPIRVVVTAPLAGVTMKVQRGRDELLSPIVSNGSELRFEFDMTADLTGAGVNFLGKYAQGPKDARFVYVNSGKRAAQGLTCWDRRAKLSLMSITKEQIDKIISNDALLIETTMPGVGRDGGPTCASVKGLEWKVAKK